MNLFFNKGENIVLPENGKLLKDMDGEFDPQFELEKILKISDLREKEVSLKLFKLRLMEQQRGFALLKEEIFKYVSARTIEAEKLFDIVDDFQSVYKFSEEQMRIIKSMIDLFLNRHEAVLDFYDEHKGDAKEMYKDLFGVDPKGDLRVVLGPVSTSFVFRGKDITDYARLYFSNFNGGEEIKKESLDKANRSGGVFTHHSPKRGLEHTIIGVKNDSWYTNETIKHEEQHALNSIYFRYFRHAYRGPVLYPYDIGLSKDSNEAMKSLVDYCRNVLLTAGEEVKDEILAYKFENTGYSFNLNAASNREKYIIETLTKPASKGGIYDYFDFELILKNIKKESGVFPNFADLYKKAKEILLKDYKDMIVDGIKAVNLLKYKGYSDESVVSILMPRRLRDWRKTADRIIQKSVDIEDFVDRYNSSKTEEEVENLNFMPDFIPADYSLKDILGHIVIEPDAQ